MQPVQPGSEGYAPTVHCTRDARTTVPGVPTHDSGTTVARSGGGGIAARDCRCSLARTISFCAAASSHAASRTAACASCSDGFWPARYCSHHSMSRASLSFSHSSSPALSARRWRFSRSKRLHSALLRSNGQRCFCFCLRGLGELPFRLSQLVIEL